jgi:hypothetical protein
MTALAATVLVGTVLNAGTPCPALRLDDGVSVVISPVPAHVKTGDRVALEGRYRFSFSCQKEIFAFRTLTIQEPR